jgi:hypothetical protein
LCFPPRTRYYERARNPSRVADIRRRNLRIVMSFSETKYVVRFHSMIRKLGMMILLGLAVCAYSLVPSTPNHFVGGYPMLRKSLPVSRRSARFFCTLNPEFDNKKIVTSSVRIPTMRSRNPYELMTYSRFKDTDAKCVNSYYTTNVAAQVYSKVFDVGFTDSFKRYCEAGAETKIPQTIKGGDQYELDLCMICQAEEKLNILFQNIASGEDLFTMNDMQQAWEEITISAGDVLYFEVCEEVEKLPSKLFQVEQTLQLWETCFPEDVPFPKAAGIILDGNRDKFVSVVKKLIQESKWEDTARELKLRNLPFFILYTNYDNVYFEVLKIENVVLKIEKEILAFKDRIDSLVKLQFLMFCAMIGGFVTLLSK